MNDFLAAIQQIAEQSKRFARTEMQGETLRCDAKDAASPAWYIVDRDGDGWAVSLLTADRWLSESIEGDMLEGRDTAEELIDDELVEVGFEGRAQQVKHFRDDDKRYVFRSRIPGATASAGAADAARAALYLLSFEAAFANLGDMQAESST